jgi:hypothetical protein
MGFQMKTQIQFSGSRRENGYIGIRFRVRSFRVQGSTSTRGDHERRRI